MSSRVRVGRSGAALLLASLPGCATFSLWDREFPKGTAMDMHPVRYAGTTVSTQQVELVQARDGDGLVLAGAPGASSWRLRPGEGADAAACVLAAAEFARVGTARVVDARRLLDERVQYAETRLALAAPAHVLAPAEIVDRASLAPAALAVLAEMRHEGSAFAAEPWLRVPPVLRRAVERVSGQVLRKLLGTDDALRLVSFVFVGEDGGPRFEPGTPAPAMPADPRAPIAAPVTLLVRVVHGERDVYLRFPPEVLRLWAACELRAGALRHESTWQLEPLPHDAVPPPAGEGLAVRLVRSEARYRQVARAEHAGWVRVVLTPFALAADLTVLLPYTLFAWGASARDDDGRDTWHWF